MPNSKNEISVISTSKWGRINLDLTCRKLPRLRGEMLHVTGPFQWYLSLDKIRGLISGDVDSGFEGDDEWIAFSSSCPASIRLRIEGSHSEFDLDGILIEDNGFYYLPGDGGSYLGGAIEIIDLENVSKAKRMACAPDGIFKEYASCWKVTHSCKGESECIAKALFTKNEKQLELSYYFNKWVVSVYAKTTSKPELKMGQVVAIADKQGILEAMKLSVHDQIVACVLTHSAFRNETVDRDGTAQAIDSSAKSDLVFRGDFSPEEQRKIKEYMGAFDSNSYAPMDGPMKGFKLAGSWLILNGFEIEEHVII
jgi:hypothetical protein